MEKWMTVSEACELVSLPQSTWRKSIRGLLPESSIRKRGRNVMVFWPDFLQVLYAREYSKGYWRNGEMTRVDEAEHGNLDEVIWTFV